ncbi:choice-of-anchor Q domain-containing protein [Pedobacter alpinus]|uniref:Choice-of-anchor Q domain-containing protein n=1 Tax=Pedobacter alpinus TaxID=1590643 RepID=A0ABW5TN96_9SPHI
MMKKLLLSCIICLTSIALWAQIVPNGNGIVYVKATAVGSGNGSNWANATGNLQNAINATGVSKVYVAAGTYQTASGVSYNMKNGVAIYGGFPNTGTPVFADRNTTANETILQGNNASVIKNLNLDATAVLDGFTITGGNAFGANGTTSAGPPLFPGFPGPDIVKNGENGVGGGIYNENSSASFSNLIISNNTAKGGNGFLGNGSGTPGAGLGGGMYNSNSSPTLTYVIIKNNTALGGNFISGGGFGGGGGILNTNSSSPILTNVVLSDNTAQSGENFGSANGGAIKNQTSSSPILTNVTIVNNKALVGTNNGGTQNTNGGAIINENSSNPIIRNCIVYGNNTGITNSASTPVITYSLVQGLAADAVNHNIDGVNDPLFTSVSDFTVKIGSPAVNLGNHTYYAAGQTPNLSAINLDLAGNVRIQKGKIDLGAYESPFEIVIKPDANGVIYVKTSATGLSNGSSWANATDNVQEAINATGVSKVYVAAGTYQTASGISYNMKNGVAIYGGFPNTGTPVFADRNTTANESILKGNNASVIKNLNLDATAVLDGFTVTGGNAFGENGTITSPPFNPMNPGSNFPTIRNGGNGYGGGIYNDRSSATFNNLIIRNNTAKGGDGAFNGAYSSFPGSGFGGGIYNSNSSPKITNVTIKGNEANGVSYINGGSHGFGGGIYNTASSSPILTNVIVSNNKAQGGFGGAGGYGQGGGINNQGASIPVLTNVTIANNSALTSSFFNSNGEGGAIYNAGSSNLIIKNSIIYGNNTGVHNNSSSPVITYSLVQGLAADATNYNLDGATNPMFVSSSDYQLQINSAAINKGSNSYYAAAQTPDLSSITTDIAGNTRIQKVKIDLGAYESPYDMALKPDANGIVYVKTASTGTGDGSSWANATGDLQQAIQQTTAKVYVAAGIYMPNYTPNDLTLQTPKNRDNSFVLKNNIKIYGGFSATMPEANPSLRDTSASSTNKSILSGDFDGDDVDIFAHNAENAKHVVYAEGNVGTALLNGFTISGGNADASSSGGGIFLSGSNPTLTNLTVIGNHAASNGGGIYNRYSGTNSNPILINVIISGNQAGNIGGGIYNDSGTIIITNAIISGNVAGVSGGGLQNGDGTVTITNLTMSGNAAANGGGLFNHIGSVKIRNSIIYGNSSGVDNGDSKPIISYSILQGSGGSSAWTASKATDGGNNLDVDPMFTNAPNFSTAPFIGGDYTLQLASPALNTGSNTFYAAGQTPSLVLITTDLAGKPRLNTIVDMGAYEKESALPVNLLSYTAKAEANGARLNWQTASEQNSKLFIISRSIDGINFEAIGNVNGKGDSNSLSNYTFLDLSASKGNNYYKLVQVDLDGKVKQLGVKVVNLSLAQSKELLIYPNPSTTIAHVKFTAGVYEKVALLDLSGRILQSKSIGKESDVISFNLTQLSSGTYLIRLTGNNESVSKLLIKQ